MALPKYLKVGLITLAILVGSVIGVFAILAGYVSWKRHAFVNQADSRDLTDRIEKMAGTYLSSRPRVALVVGVYQRGQTWTGGFGTTNPGAADSRPDGDTLFEIGSITKVFTGVLLADAVNRGAVGLDDPIAGFLPSGFTMDEGDRRRITFKQLATHTSGLPRLPANFFELAKGHESNPYAGQTREKMFESLKNVTLEHPPGAAYDYSNYGTALLGQLLAGRQGQPYSNLIEQLITRALEMNDTVLALDTGHKSRLVEGQTDKGEPASGWDMAGYAPAGGLHSSASDMLKFIAASLHPADDELGRALNFSLRLHGRESAINKVGLGWHELTTIQGLTLWWHNGGTGGYVSYLGIDPEHDNGVIVLANCGDAMAGKFDVDKIGVNILTLAAKVTLE